MDKKWTIITFNREEIGRINRTLNGPNKLESYTSLGWKGLLVTNTLAYWAHSFLKRPKKGVGSSCQFVFLSFDIFSTFHFVNFTYGELASWSISIVSTCYLVYLVFHIFLSTWFGLVRFSLVQFGSVELSSVELS